MTSIPLHIGIVAPEFPPDIGGMQIYAYEYVQELVRRGYLVTVYTERHKEERSRRIIMR